MKKCTGCNEFKKLTDFSLNCRTKSGLNFKCKKCVSEYYLLNREAKISKQREYRLNNVEACIKRSAEWKINNKDKRDAYRFNNRERVREQRIEYIEKYPEKVRDTMRRSYQKHKEKRLAYRILYLKQRLENDELFRIKEKIRARIKAFFYKSSIVKRKSTIELLGCEFQVAKGHIESQFKEGMTWDNHGVKGWHIDHIIPVSMAKNEEDVIRLFHYKNLQPLWWHENLKKSNKIL